MRRPKLFQDDDEEGMRSRLPTFDFSQHEVEEDEDGILTAPLSSAHAAPVNASIVFGPRGTYTDPRAFSSSSSGAPTQNNTFTNSSFGNNPLGPRQGTSMFGRYGGNLPFSTSESFSGPHGGSMPSTMQQEAEAAKALKDLEDDLFMRRLVPLEENADLHYKFLAEEIARMPKPVGAQPPWWLSRQAETSAALRRPYAEKSQAAATEGQNVGPTADFIAFSAPSNTPKPIIVRDPPPNSIGMLRGQQDLALPPPKRDLTAVSAANSGPRTNRGATFGKGGQRARNDSNASSLTQKGPLASSTDGKTGGFMANFDLEDETPFAVERDYRDKDHARLQQVVYPPLRKVVAQDDGSIQPSDEVNEVLRKYRSDTVVTSTHEHARDQLHHADGGTFVPFSVRPMGHAELKFTPEDARIEAEHHKANNRKRAVEEALDISTATVVTEPFRRPARRNLADEELAIRELIAFDDDDPFTFKARRLRNSEVVEELFVVAAQVTVEKADDAFTESRDRALGVPTGAAPSFSGIPTNASFIGAFGDISSFAGLGSLPDFRLDDSSFAFGGSINASFAAHRALQQQHQFAAMLANNAVIPKAVAIGDGAFIFSHDYSSCVCFRPADRSSHSDEWRRVPLSCDSVVAQLYVGGEDAEEASNRRSKRALEKLQRRRDRQHRRAILNANSRGRHDHIVSTSSDSEDGSESDEETARLANTVLVEQPQLPAPNSILVTFSHPIMRECVIALSPDHRMYGCSCAPRPMQGYVGGCWKFVMLPSVGLVHWAHFIGPSTLLVRAADKTFSVPIDKLLDAMLEEYANAKDVLGAIAAGDDDRQSLLPSTSSQPSSSFASRRASMQRVASVPGQIRRRSTVTYPTTGQAAQVNGPSDSPPIPLGAVPATPDNLQRLRAGGIGAFGGVILDDTDASMTLVPKPVKCDPPEDVLVPLPYPGLAYSTHRLERRDRVTGELITNPADTFLKTENKMFTMQQNRITAELKRVGDPRRIPAGLSLFPQYNQGIPNSKKTSTSPNKPKTEKKEDEEVGEYYYDYEAGRYLPKQRNIKNRNVLLTEGHTWIWVYSPQARNFIPLQRLDGLFDPLPVTLRNHLKGPEEVAALAGDTYTTFFFGEETIKVGMAADESARQTFLKIVSRSKVVEAPSAQVIKLYEREKRRDQATQRTKAAGNGTGLSDYHIKLQLQAVKEQRLKAAQAAGRRALQRERLKAGSGALISDESDDGGTEFGDGVSTVNTSYMGKVPPRLLATMQSSAVGNVNQKANAPGTTESAGALADTDADPLIAAAAAIAAKPLADRITVDKALPRIESSVHVKASRIDVGLAIPMSNRRVALITSDFRTYVVVEVDRYAHAKRQRGFQVDEEDEMAFEL